jgi:tripartite-type tricarboxylate transporter receptor subunit TctC
VLSVFAGTVAAQGYPSRPVRIVTSGVGGGSDFTARRVAEGITAALGQPVVVENRGGGGAGTGGIVAKATPDGYTLLVGSNSLWIGPLFDKMPYDIGEFVAVSTVSISPLVLVVHPSLPANSVKEVIALAKAKPGELNAGSTAVGGTIHLAGELFKAMAGVKFVSVPYKGGGDAIVATVGGQVQLMFASGSGIVPQIKAGRVRALAVISPQPTALFPGSPTVAASGVPGYEAVGLDGILAPAKTPMTVVRRLSQEIVRALSAPEMKERFFVSGVEASSSSPEEFAGKIKSETARIGKVIKDTGLKVEK